MIDRMSTQDVRNAAKAAALVQELAQVDADLDLLAPDDLARRPLQARKGSLLRSLRWYESRGVLPKPRQIEVLGVGVSEQITTTEAS